MNRLQRTALAASLIGVGGIALAVFVAARMPSSAQRLKTRIESERLFQFGRLSVTKAVVERTEETFELRRDDAFSWSVGKTVFWPADLQAVEAMIDQVAGLRAVREVYAQPSARQLEDTGLSKPELRLRVTTREAEHRLVLGSVNRLTDLLHAREEDGPVVLVDPGFRWAVDRPFTDFRNDRLFPFSADDVAEIALHRANGTGFRLTMEDESPRVTVGDSSFVAGEGEVAVFVAAVTLRLEAEAYVSDEAPFPTPPSSEGARVEPASAVVLKVRSRGGHVRTATIALATSTFQPQPTPYGWVGPSLVELYAPAAEEVVRATAEGLRDRTLSRFPPSRAARVRMKYGRQAAWTFERDRDDRDAWSRTHPSPASARPSVMRDIVFRFASLKGASTVTRRPTAKERRAWLLEPPSRRFEFFDADGELLADVRIGDYASEEALYVEANGRVDVVPMDELLRIPVALTRYLE